MHFFVKHQGDFEISIVNHVKWPEFTDQHYHDGYELYYLLSGETKYLIESSVYDVHEGDIIIIPPYVKHITRPNILERHRRILVNFSQVYLDDCLNGNLEIANFLSKPQVISPNSKKNNFRKIFNFLLEEYLSELPDSDLSIKGLFLTCLAQLNRIHIEKLPSGKTLNSISPIPFQLQILLNYIDSNYSRQITLEDLANQVHLNPVYVSSLFKKNLGHTFKEHLISVRLNAATKLLKDSNSTVEKIAFDCGFNSCNHFCKTFKKSTGISPSTFRNSDKYTVSQQTLI